MENIVRTRKFLPGSQSSSFAAQGLLLDDSIHDKPAYNQNLAELFPAPHLPSEERRQPMKGVSRRDRQSAKRC